ncbi:hypothetical protein [Nocardia inohanensis]|uniref:hypothetical protein n=1 Tax=Nocardia inohanensis TaxID=209246 RepID=UPI0012F71E71|nr:hypothetical protein [Nocardia inohanensis]
MKKFAAAIAISAGLTALTMGTAHAEELIADTGYQTLEACDAEGSRGSWTAPGGREITSNDGWLYQCQQHNDGAWYPHFVR